MVHYHIRSKGNLKDINQKNVKKKNVRAVEWLSAFLLFSSSIFVFIIVYIYIMNENMTFGTCAHCNIFIDRLIIGPTF